MDIQIYSKFFGWVTPNKLAVCLILEDHARKRNDKTVYDLLMAGF